jgi:NTE family protein
MKRALVLSGGGSHAAYEVGAVRYLVGTERRKYSILCGTSAGALNAAYLAQYRHGAEWEAAEDLYSAWMRLRTSRVRRHWRPFGPFHGFFKPSFFSTEPLKRTIANEIDPLKIRDSAKALAVGAVSLADGTYRTFTDKTLDILGGVLASSAFPGMFEPIEVDGRMWIDGGVREMTPLASAISMGATHIDVVMCHQKAIPVLVDKDPSAFQILVRTVQILMSEIIENDLRICGRINDLVNLGADWDHRYIEVKVQRPSEAIQFNPMTFDPVDLGGAIILGEKDARSVWGLAPEL